MICKLFDVQRNSFADGPGIRTAIFFRGCNLRCAWCHNPEGQSGKKEIFYYAEKCLNCKRCSDVCPKQAIESGKIDFRSCDACGICCENCPADALVKCGYDCTVDELFSLISKDKSYYDNSGGGVTFSGGECMLQAEAVRSVAARCKEHGISTAIDTAGNVPFAVFEKVIPYTDLFLYDIKVFDREKHIKYTGIANDLILQNYGRLLQADATVWVRIPVIPSVNDDEQEMEKIRDFAFSFRPYVPQKIELLPYHRLGEGKYRALGRSVPSFDIPDAVNITHLRQVFEKSRGHRCSWQNIR